jgi:hypothetical protein
MQPFIIDVYQLLEHNTDLLQAVRSAAASLGLDADEHCLAGGARAFSFAV